MTAFPLARFQQAGTSPSVIAQLQTAWALLSPAVQDAEALYIESVSNYQLASITSLPASGGAVSAPSGTGVIYVSPSNTAQLGSDGTVGGPSGSPLAPSVVSGGSGTHAARPTPTTTNPQLYYESDTGLTYFWDGSAWQLVKPGVELGYAEVTSAATQVRAGSDVINNVAGMSITVTVGSRPIRLMAGGPYIQYSASGGAAKAAIFRSDTSAIVAFSQFFNPGTANASVPWACSRRLSLAAGSYTFTLQLGALFADGTATMQANANAPAWLTAVEI